MGSALLLPSLVACGAGQPPPPAATTGRNEQPATQSESADPACSAIDPPYQPKPPPQVPPPSLPLVELPSRPIKIGEAYTVWGAVHHLRSRVHRDDVDGKKISIVGYVVHTNYSEAPTCAVHATGKADPPGCRAPLPMFSIADRKGETTTAIWVMGWASNFAQIFSLIQAIDRAPEGKAHAVRLADEFWGLDLPNPLPSVGAKVKVSGTYGITFTKATSGAAVNPQYGIMTAETIETLEPSPEKPTLPGMKRK